MTVIAIPRTNKPLWSFKVLPSSEWSNECCQESIRSYKRTLWKPFHASLTVFHVSGEFGGLIEMAKQKSLVSQNCGRGRCGHEINVEDAKYFRGMFVHPN